jgi:hypothetical protein
VTTIPPATSANHHAGNITHATARTMIPCDPLPHSPGAFAIDGQSAREDDNFTYAQRDNSTVVDNAINTPGNPTAPVEARLVDTSVDVENLQEQLERQQQQLEEMQRRQENIVVGQVLGVDNNNEHEDNDVEEAQDAGSSNKDPSSSNTSMCGSKRKVAIAVIAVLAVVAIVVVSIVVGTLLNSQKDASDKASPPTSESSPVDSPTAAPMDSGTPAPTSVVDDWKNECDESSSSLAKRLPCVSLDESKFCYLLDCQVDCFERFWKYRLVPFHLTDECLDNDGQPWCLSLFIVLASNTCLLAIFHSKASLDLSDNTLTGSIPTEIGLFAQLSESVFVWLLCS